MPFKQWVWSSNLQRVTKKDTTHPGGVFFASRGDSNNLNATVRWTVAADGLTEAILNLTNLQRVTYPLGKSRTAGHNIITIAVTVGQYANESPVAVPCVRLGANACVAHRPRPLAPLPLSATGGGRVAPQRVTYPLGNPAQRVTI